MKQKKIIIFDMDGVLLDSEPLHEIARQRMFERLEIVPDENFPSPVGNSASGYWDAIIAYCQLEGTGLELEREQYRLVAEQIVENQVPPSDGLLEVFAWAKERDIKLGLASSSTRVLVDDALRLLGIGKYFDCTVAGDEIAHKKPAPDPYLRVLELSGMAAEDAVAVEDSCSGTLSAKAAGMECFGYANPTSGNQDLSNSTVVIRNLREIMGYLA